MWRRLFILAALACGVAVAPQAAQADREITPCASLSFPGPAPEEIGAFASNCFVYADRATYNWAIYPDTWGVAPDADHMLLLNYTLDALANARPVYRRYEGEIAAHLPFVADLVVVLTETVSTEHEAITHTGLSDDVWPCWMVVNPASWNDGKLKYKFDVAHETAHCFFRDALQASNKRFQYWWTEGAVEYFASVVYPGLNIEHRNASNYANITPLIDYCMDYPPVVFFQHYANTKGGPGEVLKFLQRMNAAADLDEVRHLLASEADFASVFHNFVIALNTKHIADPGGGFMPFPYEGESVPEGEECKWHELMLDPISLDGDAGEADFVMNVEPLAAEMRIFVLQLGYDYRLSPMRMDEGHVKASYARVAPSRYIELMQSWDGEILLHGDCDVAMQYDFVATSVDPTAEDRGVRFTATPEPITSCNPCPPEQVALDSCMRGSWRMDDKGFAEVIEQFRSMLERRGGEPATVAESVAYNILTKDDQTMICNPNRYETISRTEVKGSGSNGDVRVTLYINTLGSSVGHICTDRAAHTVKFVSSYDQALNHGSYIEASGGGQSMQLPLGQSATFPSGRGDEAFAVPYKCTQKELTLTVKEPHSGESVDFVLERMSDEEIEQVGRLQTCQEH